MRAENFTKAPRGKIRCNFRQFQGQIAGVIAGIIFIAGQIAGVIAGQIAPAITPEITVNFAPGGFPRFALPPLWFPGSSHK